MFWFLGLPGAILWGTVMAVFALIPMLGAFVVWVPAALFLLATGHPGKALILTIWGAVVIGTADNVLYPILVGKDLHLHTITIFFSVLGAVAAFGVSGLVIGPVIFAIADALLEIWSRRGPTPAPSAESA
jgi:predicted PurR-regulated permease PerM